MTKRMLTILGLVLALAAAPAGAQQGDAGKKPAEPKTATAPEKAAESKGAEKAAQPAAPQAAEKTAKSGAALELARLDVCRDVEDRAPVGAADSFDGVSKLYCFTRVEGAKTPTMVYHRWYVGDRMVNEIPINVKGPRWRCWSEKTILPSWHGQCRVEVADEEGDILGTKTFTLAAAAPGKSQEAPGQEKAEAAQQKASQAKQEAGEAAHHDEAHEGAGHHGGQGDDD